MNEKYNYRMVIYDDIDNHFLNNDDAYKKLKGHTSIYDMQETLEDELFMDDSITGNASGSYFFNTWESEEAICHNMDILTEMLDEGYITDISDRGFDAEYLDVCIRCYLLHEVLAQYLEDNYDTIIYAIKEYEDEDN